MQAGPAHKFTAAAHPAKACLLELLHAGNREEQGQQQGFMKVLQEPVVCEDALPSYSKAKSISRMQAAHHGACYLQLYLML
jgi:hypothetical protein